MTTPTQPPPGTTPTPGEFLRSAKAAKSDKKEPGQAVSTKGKTAEEVMEEKRRKALRAKEAAKGEVKRGTPKITPQQENVIQLRQSVYDKHLAGKPTGKAYQRFVDAASAAGHPDPRAYFLHDLPTKPSEDK